MTFASVKGIEPTNNAAERALRFAVIWRRISGGTDSQRGSRFVERTLSVVGDLPAARPQRAGVPDVVLRGRSSRSTDPLSPADPASRQRMPLDLTYPHPVNGYLG